MTGGQGLGPGAGQRTVRGRALLAGQLALVALAVAGVASGVVAVSASLGGYRLLVVASGSMAPALTTGDVILTRPVRASSLHPGQVVTFVDPSRAGRLVTHRVRTVDVVAGRVAVETRGDANTGSEHWTVDAAGDVGSVVARVGGGGPALGWLTGPVGRSLAGAPVILIGAALLRRIWARPPPRSPGAGSGANGAAPSSAPGRRARRAVTSLVLGAGLAGLAGFWLSVTVSAFSSTVTNASSLSAAAMFAPAGLTGSSGLDAQVPLTWSPVSGATDYQLQWRTDGTGAWTQAGWTGGATSSTVTGLTNNTVYEFQVQARNGGGSSAWSASVTGTPRQWAQVSAGYYHTCAVTVSGRAYCWGQNVSGQLGNGTRADRAMPVPVATSSGLTGSNVGSISAGYGQTCAVTTAGRAYCWGANDSGQVGDTTSGTDRLTPTAVDTTTGLTTSNVASITTDLATSCAVTTAGRGYCWGDNSTGEVGDGTTIFPRLTPTGVDTSTGLTTTNVAKISLGPYNTCALTTTGQAYCWGWNYYGQLGDNTTTSRLAPTAVDTSTGLTTTNVTTISTAGSHTCVRTTAGRAFCWGYNGNGQVGDNTSGTDRLTPTAVDTTTGLTTTNVADISAGDMQTCATTTTGRGYCWGDDTDGQLGDNSSGTERLTPTAVATTAGLTTTDVAAISAGGTHDCALTTAATGGAVACWGANGTGEIGDATTGTDRLTPTAPATTAIPAAPSTPSGPAGTSWQSGQVPLTWAAVSGATDYQVQYRVDGSGGAWTQLDWQTGTGATVGSLADGTTYEFQVRAHNAGGNSAWSASVTAQPNTSPGGLATTSGLDAQVSLSWTAAPGATDYQVQWRTNGTGSWTATGWTGGATSTTVTGLTNNTVYEFQVEASNAFGAGPWSPSVVGTPGSGPRWPPAGPTPARSPSPAAPTAGARTATASSATAPPATDWPRPPWTPAPA